MQELKNTEKQNIPNVTFKSIKDGEWVNITTTEIFKNKNVIVFSLPGAMTPTCSNTHLPRYDELYDVFKENNIDEIVCISVNDTFVMNAWKKELGIKNIKMIPDGNGEFTEKMGMLVDKSELGFGKRSWRYSMLVKNEVIEKMNIEPIKDGDPFEVSDADTMLDYINPNSEKPKAYTILTRDGCPFCAKAKEYLEDRNINYDEIKSNTKVLRSISGKNTYPQIFSEGILIGGYDDLISKI